MRTETFTFADVETGQPCKVAVTVETGGLCIKPEGTGTFDGDCGPIYLEVQNGRPVLYVWSDINGQEPVKLDLAAALESNRQAAAM
jgi:hypothetical protein